MRCPSVGATVLFLGVAFSPTASAAVLFSDNFESSPIGNDTVGNTPIADVGAYSGYAPAPSQSQTNGIVVAGGSTVTGSAGPLVLPTASLTGGANYLRSDTSGSLTIGERHSGLLSSPATILGTTFHYELEQYVGSTAANVDLGFGIGSEAAGESCTGSGPGPTGPPNTRPRLSLQFRQRSGQLQLFSDPDGDLTNAYAAVATYTPDAWNKYEIDYVLGTNSLSVKVNGGTAVVINDPFASTTTGQVNSLSRVDTVFVFTTGSNTIGYTDNMLATGVVPEPTAIGLVGLAGLLVVRRPRRTDG
jgi:hypothetical protein